MIHAEPLSDMKQTRGPRLPLASRPRTFAQRELYARGITNRMLAEATGMSLSTVNRALSLQFSHRVAHGDVLRVRLTAERLLHKNGLAVSAHALWYPYDCAIHLSCEPVAVTAEGPT